VSFELNSHSNADLASEDAISESQITEAIQYRSMDKRLFG
jgi:predicted ATPase with chaperone activity